MTAGTEPLPLILAVQKWYIMLLGIANWCLFSYINLLS